MENPVDNCAVRPDEVEISAIRAQGAGGQNVNKVASAVHLRFDIRRSSLPEAAKARLLELGDRRISADGVIIIKAQRHRTRDRNIEDAMQRLQALVDSATVVRVRRIPTRPSGSSRRQRLDEKRRRGTTKSLRRAPGDN
jgi:ribosome-associated protein